MSLLQQRTVRYVLRNTGPKLKEFILAVRFDGLNDAFLRSTLVDNDLRGLEKFLVIVPGKNNMPNILDLNIDFAEFVLEFCPKMMRLGNLFSWKVREDRHRELIHRWNAKEKPNQNEKNVTLEIMYRQMTFR